MPPGFEFPIEEGSVDLWRPLPHEILDPASRTSHYLSVLGRLAPDATPERAQEEMSALAARITAAHPAEMTGWGARVVPLREDITRNVTSLFWFLLGGVGLLLLITCANLANLLFARSLSRTAEMNLRGALGARRGRLLRQLLTESAMLAALGCTAAILISPVALEAIVRAAPTDLPLLGYAEIDVRMLLFAALVGIGSALAFGLAPALRILRFQLPRFDFAAELRKGKSVSAIGQVGIRSGLLVAQVAFSMILLVGTGLLVRSFREIQRVQLGFDPRALVSMEVEIPESRYPDVAAQAAFFTRVRESVAGIPGVSAVAASSQPLGTGSFMTMSFAIEGRPSANPSGREDPQALHAVSPGYFEVLGQRVVAGRAFDSNDRADGAPVVIVNESLARRHFADGTAVGSMIAFRVGETPWLEIVGVVADARVQSPDQEPEPALYIPFEQAPYPWLTWMTILARVTDAPDPLGASTSFRAAVTDVDPNVASSGIRTVNSAFGDNMAQRTFALTLVAAFASVSLFLLLVGLYGLMTYWVERERREIGVRIALGADGRRIVLRVVTRALVLTGLGVCGGLLAAAGASRVVTALLYQVSPVDAVTYATAAALVVAVTLVTAVVPSIRAARIDPLVAMRAD
jgi:predicted permease